MSSSQPAHRSAPNAPAAGTPQTKAVDPGPFLGHLQPPDATVTSRPWLRGLLFHSLMAALCPLIPAPFLDDWALAFTRSRLTRDALRQHGLATDSHQIRVLTFGPTRRRGCIFGVLLLPVRLLVTIVIRIVRKLLRVVLMIFTVRACVDALSAVLHRGYLLHAALEQGLFRVPGNSATEGCDAVALHALIEDVCRTADTRPVDRLVGAVLRHSRERLRRTARRVGHVLSRARRQPEEQAAAEVTRELSGETERLAPVMVELAAIVNGNWDYFLDLEGELLRRYAARRSAETR